MLLLLLKELAGSLSIVIDLLLIALLYQGVVH